MSTRQWYDSRRDFDMDWPTPICFECDAELQEPREQAAGVCKRCLGGDEPEMRPDTRIDPQRSENARKCR